MDDFEHWVFVVEQVLDEGGLGNFSVFHLKHDADGVCEVADSGGTGVVHGVEVVGENGLDVEAF